MLRKVAIVTLVLLFIAVGPTPSLSAAPASSKLNKSEIESMIRSMFGPDNAAMALSVSMAENDTRECGRRSPRNKNGTYDWGVFQINDIHRSRFSMYDFTKCDENILVAYILFLEEGWRPWTTYKTGAYKRFLDRYAEP